MFKLFSAEGDTRTLEAGRAQHHKEVDNLNRLLGKACAERDYPQRRVLTKLGIDVTRL